MNFLRIFKGIVFCLFVLTLLSCGGAGRFEYITHHIDGHAFKVSYGYIPDHIHYSSDDVTVSGVLLRAYLPDMRPWRTDVAKWKNPRDPDVVRMLVETSKIGIEKKIENMLNLTTKHFGKYKNSGWESYGLYMPGLGKAPEIRPNIYFFINRHGVNGTSIIRCDYKSRGPNPLCDATFYLDDSLSVNFWFLQERMDEWESIERKVYDLVRGFENAAGNKK